jgi:hypothetical protein
MQSGCLVLRRLISSLLVALLATLATGCESYPLTYALWKKSELVRHCEPAPNPRLQLFQSVKPNDILVQYDELRERNDAVRRRAFYLYANLSKLEARRKPSFVSLDKAGGLIPILVIPSPGGDSSAPAGPAPYATISTNGFNFTIHSANGVGSEFYLPAYEDSLTQAQRVFLTPVTVVGDVVVGAVAVGTVLGLIWLTSGAPGIPN